MQPTSSDGERALAPLSGSWSRQDWVAERSATRIAYLSAEVPKLCEAAGPTVLFLEGSALHGELCGIEDPDGARTCLSDLDLGILTKERIPLAMRERIASDIEGGGAGWSADAPIAKIGFYCEADLGVQDPTLSFVEAVRRPLVLWGDPRALARFRVPDYARIPVWEGRRLAANRVLEWLASRAKTPAASAYAGAKLIADTAAVALLSRGAYQGGGYADRLEAALRLAGLPEGLRVRMRDWTEWRLEPCWGKTPLGVGLSDLDPRLMEREVGASLVESMRFAAGTDEPGVFLGANAVRGRVWARSWKRWLRRSSVARLRAGWMTRTPRILLFEAALLCVLRREEASQEILGRLAKGVSEEAAAGHGSLAARIVGIGELMSREGID